MKRVLALFMLFCLFLTACGTDEHAAENISEIESKELDEQTVTKLVTTESVTEPPVAETEAETLSVTAVPSETESISGGDTQTIGDEDYGYLNVSSDWKYKEPMVVEAPSIEYTDGKGNSISIRLYAEWGADGQYIYSDESIDDIAKRYYESVKEFKNAKMDKLEYSAPMAYRLTYTRTVRTDNGRGEVSWGDRYFFVWMFDFADATKLSVTFSGDEGFSANADRIIRTYRLRKVPPEAEELQTIGDDEYGYLDTVYNFEYESDDHGRACMKYADGYGNSITFKNSGRFGFGIDIKSVDRLAEEYYDLQKGYFRDAEMVKTEVDGHTAYKQTNSRTEAVDNVNYGYEYMADWIFERSDGVNWSVIFVGDEEFVKMSDDIMQTYHLYK